MSCPSQVEKHPERQAIEVMLAAGAPLDTIATRFGVSVHSAGRHRTRLKEKSRSYFVALRREVQARGLNRQSFAPTTTDSAEGHDHV